MGAIERVSLEPFLAASLSRGTGVYDDSKSAWHQILDHRLARQGRRRFAVRLGSRANNDHANGSAYKPVTGSIDPWRAFVSGSLNMSYVICPVASPLPPASSQSMTWKSPRPTSWVG